MEPNSLHGGAKAARVHRTESWKGGRASEEAPSEAPSSEGDLQKLSSNTQQSTDGLIHTRKLLEAGERIL